MEENNGEERRKLLLSKIARFRLFDDDFMSKVFEDDIEATDKDGKLYDIEVQRADEGASETRARFYSAVLDANSLLLGQGFDELPETYVIFITEHDVLRGGFPIYHINRKIEETGMTFCDKSHILYVNGQYRGDDAIGRLMHDFSCADPDDMNSSVLAGRTRYLKNDDKGVRQMSIVMEELVNEILAEEKREQAEEFAISLLKSGKLTNEEIAKTFNLPEERVRELAEQAAEPVLA